MDGIIFINKPAGMTSFAVVNKCKHIFHEKKIGHSGTLDPNAEGLLIVFMGKYTKLIPFCIHDHKHYVATFSLGKKTTTQDIWGEVVMEKEYADHSQNELDNVSRMMTGTIQQIPPMYSALKKDGKKLYEYARQGIEVEREARTITVDSLHVKKIDENKYEMDAVVSSGTYIRTLIEDYCAKLDELGTMTSLIRYGIENVTIHQANTLTDEVNHYTFVDPLSIIDPYWEIVECDRVADIKNGKKIAFENLSDHVVFVHDRQLLAAYQKEEDGLYLAVRGLF